MEIAMKFAFFFLNLSNEVKEEHNCSHRHN